MPEDLLEDLPEVTPADASAEDRKRWFTAALIVQMREQFTALLTAY